MEFDKLLDIILDDNLGDKLSNKKLFELLFLLFITLILLPKSWDKSRIAFFDWKTSVFSFNGYKKLFLSNILSSILLLITSSGLSL